LNLYRSIATV